MNGSQFLQVFGKLQPATARILLTGYTDKENAIRSINHIGLYNYIEKPWENEELRIVVSRAFQETRLRRKITNDFGVSETQDRINVAGREEYLKKRLGEEGPTILFLI